jgi:hydrogenase maturation protease
LLIIGCGNRDRGDDGAGIMVAERLRELGVNAEICTGDALALMEAWNGVDDVVIMDAVMTGGPAGKVWLWDSGQLTVPESLSLSTHGFGLAEAISLARILNLLPKRLRVLGIEGRRFDLGNELSQEVMLAVEELAEQMSEPWLERQNLQLERNGAPLRSVVWGPTAIRGQPYPTGTTIGLHSCASLLRRFIKALRSGRVPIHSKRSRH